jgi:hypothetical protein
VLLPFWPKNPVAVTLELHLQLLPTNPTNASASGTAKHLLQDSSCLARLDLPCEALLCQRSGKSYLLKDQPLRPCTASTAVAPGRLTIEVVAWDMMSYLKHLQKMGGDMGGAAAGRAAEDSEGLLGGLPCCKFVGIPA